MDTGVVFGRAGAAGEMGGGRRSFFRDSAATDAPRSIGLLDALHALQAAHPAEPVLRESWAISISLFVYGRAATDPQVLPQSAAGSYAMLVLHPDEPPLREHWAKGVACFAGGVRQKTCSRYGWLADLKALHTKHVDEPALRESWAMGVLHLVGRRAAEDPQRCLILVEDARAADRVFR